MRRKKFSPLGIESGIRWENIGRKRFLLRNGDFGHLYADVGECLNSSRIHFFFLAAAVIFFIFIGRLLQLTLVEGDLNRKRADNNRIRLVEHEGPRGKILDRRGETLAVSEPIFYLTHGKDVQEISAQQVKDLEAAGLASENFDGELGKVTQSIRRDYPFGQSASHALGYISLAQEEDLDGNPNLKQTENVGRLGIEAVYDSFLRGEAGKKLVEVDSIGKKVSILGEEASVAGRDIILTIDAALEKVAYEALLKAVNNVQSHRGAVVVGDPRTGEILALVSMPSFDGEDIGKYVSDQNKPFLNRAISGTYPPGSVFKIVTALSALEAGKITRDSEVDDVGEFELGGVKFSNWYFKQYGRKEGVIKLERAIARSNDIYFYRAAEGVGLDKLRQMAIKLGFGQKTGVDLPTEAYGLVPDEVWKKSAFSDNWYLGDTMHLGIGQGFMLVTPIQVNAMTSYVASGKVTKPYILSSISEGKSGKKVEIQSKVLEENLASEENLKLVRSGMRQACQTGGTGWPFFEAKYDIACKTGTAEKTLGNPHAWFTAYAPYDDPQVSVVVLVEDGGEGSSVAGPVAKEILDWWFSNRK